MGRMTMNSGMTTNGEQAVLERQDKQPIAHAVGEEERRMHEAEDLVRRQKRIVEKFRTEGLETSAELLYELEDELATHKGRLAGLVYEAGLAKLPETVSLSRIKL